MQARDAGHRSLYCSLAEQVSHRADPGIDAWTEAMTVYRGRHARRGVTHQIGDMLNRRSRFCEQAHARVAQGSRRPAPFDVCRLHTLGSYAGTHGHPWAYRRSCGGLGVSRSTRSEEMKLASVRRH